jgi:hypothetical protein
MLPDPGAVSGESYALLPNTSLLTLNGVIERLVQLPKPLACVALAHVRSLAIAYWPNSIDGAGARTQRHDEITADIERIRHQFANRADGPRLLLKGYNEELPLSLNDLEVWWLSYELLLPRMHFRDHPSPELREHGVDAMILYQSRGDN